MIIYKNPINIALSTLIIQGVSTAVYADEAANTSQLNIEGTLQAEVFNYQQAYTKEDSGHTGIRRADLSAKYAINDDFKLKYSLRADTESDTLKTRDAYVKYSGWSFVDIIVGKTKQPFGLENSTSSKHLAALERSAVSEALLSGRAFGVKLKSSKIKNNWEVAYSNLSLDSDDNGHRLSTRVSHSEKTKNNHRLHLGSSLQYLHGFNAHYRVKSPAEFYFSKNLIKSDKHLIDNVFSYGLEAAWQHNNLILQSEWIGQSLTLTDNSDNSEPHYSGYYALASYFLTGEKRAYKKGGRFGTVKPQHDFGAIELVSRFTSLKLEEQASDTITKSYTVGINYHISPSAKAMLHFGESTQTDSSSDTELEGKGVSLRLHMDF